MNNADINGDGETTLRELLTFLEQTYCGTIGVECEHITDLEKLNWIRERVEVHPPPMAKEAKHQLLEGHAALAHARGRSSEEEVSVRSFEEEVSESSRGVATMGAG